ncbi:MAG: cytochrome ubiquinol oxidase subunit I [Bacteroidales bacterium]|jgi:cytochrome d ubiquinol oxidase subunit I
MIDLANSLVGWSRAQFALTAIYHWIFVPLTLGLSFIVAMMETIYVRTGDEKWKRLTRFWMTLFGINFAIGVATGIILEFEFGTNWSNYSWFVGDIFGAPLAIEGILAFFLESTFIAVMFFGWNKVSKKFHLVSSWLVAIGANLSALWILVANAWMQNPVGMAFNPDTARNEMVSFRAVLFNPVAIDKFLHTIFSGFLLASVFVMGISAWYILKKREEWIAARSMLIAALFGLLSSLMVALTGDDSARTIAQVQPVKFASMEAHYTGTKNAALTAFGILRNNVRMVDDIKVSEFAFRIKIPGFLSIMTGGKRETYVPGIIDLVEGQNKSLNILSVTDKMKRGMYARMTLLDYKKASVKNDTTRIRILKKEYFNNKKFMEEYFRYLGYGFLRTPGEAVPDVPAAFYSFHIMVILGFFFILVCIAAIWFLFKGTIARHRWFLRTVIISVPLVYIASISGWILAEMGRQPWIIQDLMPVSIGVTYITAGAVLTTFVLFAVLFTALLIAEVSIMAKQIKTGPKHQEVKL